MSSVMRSIGYMDVNRRILSISTRDDMAAISSKYPDVPHVILSIEGAQVALPKVDFEDMLKELFEAKEVENV